MYLIRTNRFVGLICTQQIRNSLKKYQEKFTNRTFRGSAADLYTEINKGSIKLG